MLSQTEKIRLRMLEQLLEDDAPAVRHALALNPHLPEALRKRLAGDEEAAEFDPYACIEEPSEELEGYMHTMYKTALAEAPETPLTALLRLTKDEDGYIAGLAVRHPHMPDHLLADFARDPKLAIGVVEHPRCPVALLEKFSRHSDALLRGYVAKQPATPVPVLEQLATNYESWVRDDVAKNLRTPAAVLMRLARDPEENVRKAVGANPALPAEALSLLAADPEEEVRIAVAGNPSTPLVALIALTRKSNPRRIRSAAMANPSIPQTWLAQWVREAGSEDEAPVGVAANPAAPPELLLTLAVRHAEDYSGIAYALAENPASTAAVLSILVTDQNEVTRTCIAKHPNVTGESLAHLAADAEEEVRQAVAAHPHTLPDTLKVLASDDDARTRWLVAAHPGTPVEAQMILAEDDNEVVRANLAQHLRPAP